ncbi:MAG: hypothetical protein SVK54_06705 [candidate division WOR-3 bacterium]|nr:hypothetical protein [candidate division WOR-3 bacterium]
MKKLIKFTSILILSLVIILPLMARTATGENEPAGRKWSQSWSTVNEVAMPITNFGIFGQDVAMDDSGLYWPSGRYNETYIFGAGIWIGGKIDVDGDGDLDTLVSCGYHPNAGTSEMVPGEGTDGPSYTNENERVYVSTNDWPPKNGDGEIIYDSIVSMEDTYCEFSDMDPNRHFERENLPLGIKVYLTTYAWVGPLKGNIVFMRYQIENAREDSQAIDSVYMGVAADCDIGNEADEGENSPDDLLGFIDSLNLGYQFQLEPEPDWVNDPGIISFKYMESPVATYPIDKDHDGETDVSEGEQIGMTTFNRFTLTTDPKNMYERYLVLAGYNHLTYDPNSPELSYSPFPTTADWPGSSGYPGISESPDMADDKRFIMASGPFTLEYQDKVNIVVAIILSKNDPNEMFLGAKAAQKVYDDDFTGPVAPGQVPFNTKGMNQEVILYWDNTVELIPDPYYELVGDPGTPTEPNTMYNPEYREFDVVGYKIFKSRTGAGDSWEQIAKYDLIDDYTAVLVDSNVTYNQFGTPSVEYIYETLGTNTGVPYVFVDTNLTNGLTYFYKITAYDLNYLNYDSTSTGETFGINPLILEGPGITEAVIPRIPPLNYVESGYTAEIEANYRQIEYYSHNENDTIVVIDSVKLGEPIVHPVDQEKLELSIQPIVDTLISKIEDNASFMLKFDGIKQHSTVPIYTYSVYKVIGDDTTFMGQKEMLMEAYTNIAGSDTTQILKRKSSEAVTSDGIAFDVSDYELDNSGWALDNNKNILVNGSYPDSLVKVGVVDAGKHYFHGSKWYRVTWKEETINDTLNLTCEVMDMQNQMPIEYDSIAVGDYWHFNYSTTAGPYPEYINENSDRGPLLGMYLPSFRIYFNYPGGRPSPIDWASRPSDGDVWDIVLNEDLKVAEDYESPPVGATYSILIEKYQYGATVDSVLENIKVVPNPYVVRSEFGKDYTHRKLYFTNLPNECTISIYTISGDLIKTLEHSVDFYRNETGGDSTYVRDVTNGQVEWNVLTDNDQIPAPGLYLYYVETPDNAKYIGKFAIIK